jgi:hypothetical protein
MLDRIPGCGTLAVGGGTSFGSSTFDFCGWLHDHLLRTLMQLLLFGESADPGASSLFSCHPRRSTRTLHKSHIFSAHGKKQA